MIENIDLTEKQKLRLSEETRHLSANATNGEGYVQMYPKSRNGFYYVIIRQSDLTVSHTNTFRNIARRTRTQYMISVNENRLELRFYATFDKLPKTLL